MRPLVKLTSSQICRISSQPALRRAGVMNLVQMSCSERLRLSMRLSARPSCCGSWLFPPSRAGFSGAARLNPCCIRRPRRAAQLGQACGLFRVFAMAVRVRPFANRCILANFAGYAMQVGLRWTTGTPSAGCRLARVSIGLWPGRNREPGQSVGVREGCPADSAAPSARLDIIT